MDDLIPVAPRAKYKITLDDNTILNDLELNGNNFVSSNILDKNIFTGNIKNVIISDGDHETTYRDMVLRHFDIYDNQTYFVLSPKTEQERKDEEMKTSTATLAEAILNMQYEHDIDKINKRR